MPTPMDELCERCFKVFSVAAASLSLRDYGEFLNEVGREVDERLAAAEQDIAKLEKSDE